MNMFKYFLLAEGAVQGLVAPAGLTGPATFGEIFTRVVNVLLGLAGIVAVIFILVGAIRYAASAGNDQSVASAKKTIVNAVVGLIIAVMALAIVNFVVSITGSGNNTNSVRDAGQGALDAVKE